MISPSCSATTYRRPPRADG